MEDENKEKIAHEIIKVLYSRFISFPEDATNNRNAPFHKAFLTAFSDKFKNKVSDIPFFISLSSWLQGLNTTLGQTFFENVAHILCNGDKREFTSKKLGNIKIYKHQKDNCNAIITDLSVGNNKPNKIVENELLFKDDNDELVNSIDFSADVFIEEDENIIAIELKSVRPNSGEMRGEKQKILEGKSALYKKYTPKNISFYIGFPFDPTSEEIKPTEYDKNRFMESIINMKKYFANDEVLLSSELWDFLSEKKNTMIEILSQINKIATIEFMDKYSFINDSNNRLSTNRERYKKILIEWDLVSELEIFNNEDKIFEAIKKEKKLKRVYYQNIFKDGEYNIDRYLKLNNLI